MATASNSDSAVCRLWKVNDLPRVLVRLTCMKRPFLSLPLWEAVWEETVSGWLKAVKQFPYSYHNGAYIWNVRDFRSNRGRKKKGLIVMMNIGHVGMENR